MSDARLRIERFCGHQVHRIESVETYVSRPRIDGQPVLLNLEFHCGEAIEEVAPEGERLGWTSPMVEVWIPLPDLEPGTLADRRVHIPWSYLEERDALNRFYVCEHESWHAIDVHLRLVDGRVHITCSGLARDPNHYDGSKPEARIALSAAFGRPS